MALDETHNCLWAVVYTPIFVRRILVVDDTFIDSSSILAPDINHIVLVRDAASGLSALALSQFDLVIVDVVSPRMDGLAFIAKVRGWLTLPIIAMTAVGTSEFARSRVDLMDLVIEAGANYCLRKPFSPERLLTAITSCLGPLHQRDRLPVAEPRQIAGLGNLPQPVRPVPVMTEEERDGTARAAVANQVKEPLTVLLFYLRELRRESETNPLTLDATREMIRCALLETEKACRLVNIVGRAPYNSEDMIDLRPQAFCGSWTMPRDDSIRFERPRLTPREREVLALVVDGASNKQGGFRLSISVRTFESHRANVMSKLGARNVAQLIQIALGQAA